MRLAMVVPMYVYTTAAGCMFSDMKKNRLRNRVLSTLLPKLMIIAIESLVCAKVDFDAVLSLWKSINPEGY